MRNRKSFTYCFRAFVTICLVTLMVLPAEAQRRPRPDYEPSDPVAAPAEREAGWSMVADGLHGAVGSLDTRYAQGDVPTVEERQALSLVAWRGERVHSQLVLWSKEGATQVVLNAPPLKNAKGKTLSISPHFLRYVRADNLLCADIIDDADQLDMAAKTVRPLWVSADVPTDAAPGTYRGTLTARASGGKQVAFDISLEVLPLTLPPPKDWAFYLDLWQNPYAIARYHHVKPFSEEHFALMRPHLKLLADAGQKVLTTTILHAPWGGQTYDSYDSMVEWTRTPAGKWKWDYTVFDRYVTFGKSCGIGPYINCYSMIPWTNKLRYRDEATGDYAIWDLKPGEPSYEQVWGAFLADFSAHLKQKGWLGITRIAMDERPLPLMKAAWEVVHKYAPQMGIALAGDPNPEFKDAVTDWCAYLTPAVERSVLEERRKKGLPTTFYVCCNPARPNTFTFSPPAESVWPGLYAAGQGYTGFLRWAFDSWTEDPFFDTKHVTWDAGDCFLVYPGARTSLRFERLREGIQEYEKIRLLRQWARGTPELGALEAALAKLTLEQAQSKEPIAPLVNAVQQAILTASRVTKSGQK